MGKEYIHLLPKITDEIYMASSKTHVRTMRRRALSSRGRPNDGPTHLSRRRPRCTPHSASPTHANRSFVSWASGSGPQVRLPCTISPIVLGANRTHMSPHGAHTGVISTEPEEQHPHPFAPPELKQHFSDFLKKFQGTPAAASSAGAGASASSAKKTESSGQVFEDFWQAPSRLWKRELEEWEIDLVQVRVSPPLCVARVLRVDTWPNG